LLPQVVIPVHCQLLCGDGATVKLPSDHRRHGP